MLDGIFKPISHKLHHIRNMLDGPQDARPGKFRFEYAESPAKQRRDRDVRDTSHNPNERGRIQILLAGVWQLPQEQRRNPRVVCGAAAWCMVQPAPGGLTLHRALRRMAGLIFLLVFWVLAGACQRQSVGGFLLRNTTTTTTTTTEPGGQHQHQQLGSPPDLQFPYIARTYNPPGPAGCLHIPVR